MQIIHSFLPENHQIVKASDAHVGSLMHHENGWREMIEYVGTTPNTYLDLDGDLIEAICADDKRYDYSVLDDKSPKPIQQAKRVVRELMPIKDKILVIASGNHEYKLSHYGDLTREIICQDLDVPYGTYSYKQHIYDKARPDRLMYKIFSTHGSRNIASTADDPIRNLANLKLQLKNHLKRKAADCAIMTMGHAHKLIISEPESQLYLTDSEGRIRENYTQTNLTSNYIPDNLRWYLCSGAFLKLYYMGEAGYAERAGYDPVELGYAVVECYSGKHLQIRKVTI